MSAPLFDRDWFFPPFELTSAETLTYRESDDGGATFTEASFDIAAQSYWSRYSLPSGYAPSSFLDEVRSNLRTNSPNNLTYQIEAADPGSVGTDVGLEISIDEAGWEVKFDISPIPAIWHYLGWGETSPPTGYSASHVSDYSTRARWTPLLRHDSPSAALKQKSFVRRRSRSDDDATKAYQVEADPTIERREIEYERIAAVSIFSGRGADSAYTDFASLPASDQNAGFFEELELAAPQLPWLVTYDDSDGLRGSEYEVVWLDAEDLDTTDLISRQSIAPETYSLEMLFQIDTSTYNQ